MQILRRLTRRSRPEPDTVVDPSAPCPELAEAAANLRPVPVPPPGEKLSCEGCAALGEDHWAHLRMCLSCGYMGCCDSSPRKHATAHFHDTGHPVMRSAEPGESWRWCYVHELIG
ncbi:UBP-type zinc finger domain-containing protein [Gordonia aurantiaca]|uniref:UBP-type zinc finger domain-containing protein n=1 Tax=Gordonia sp. B21 TaxID=3151852 RepID=UPI003266B336